MNDGSASVFTRYIAESLKEERTPPTTKAQKHPAQKLLDWLLGYWPKPTIRARDIHRLGPNTLRDRQKVTDLTEILVKEGWLVRNKTRRRDMYQWGIIRKPIIHPVIAAK
jgi:hypothetical protein